MIPDRRRCGDYAALSLENETFEVKDSFRIAAVSPRQDRHDKPAAHRCLNQGGRGPFRTKVEVENVGEVQGTTGTDEVRQDESRGPNDHNEAFEVMCLSGHKC